MSISVATEIATRDLGKRAVATLAKRGVRFIALQAIPNMAHPMPFADVERGYVVDDNGTGRVWTFADCRRAAAQAVPA